MTKNNVESIILFLCCSGWWYLTHRRTHRGLYSTALETNQIKIPYNLAKFGFATQEIISVNPAYVP